MQHDSSEEKPAQGVAGKDGQTVELDLTEVVLVVWRGWRWVLAGTILSTLLGIAYALSAQEEYQATAIVAPRERQSGSAAMLSRLGGLSGLVAAEMGVGVGNLEWLEVIAGNGDLAESVVEMHDLVKIICDDQWDHEAKRWKTRKGAPVPNVRTAAQRLRRDMLSVSADQRRGVLTLSMVAPDSVLARDLAQWYLDALAVHIGNHVRNDSEANIRFLETRLKDVGDPLLREKIQAIIASEVERAMLASHSPFQVLRQPLVPLQRKWPKRKLVVMVAALVGFGLSCLLVIVRAAPSGGRL